MYKSFFIAALLIPLHLQAATRAGAADAPISMESIQKADLARAEAAFSRYLSSWKSTAAEQGLDEVFAERALIELTLPARPDWTINVGGRAAIAEYVQSRRAKGENWSFSNVHYYATLERGVVFVQYDAVSTSFSARRAHRNLVVIELDGARIAKLRDFTGARLVVNDLLEGDPSLPAGRTLARYP